MMSHHGRRKHVSSNNAHVWSLKAVQCINASLIVLAEHHAMHKVHRFWSPITGAYHLLTLAVVLWSRRECRGSEQHCHLALCSLSGMTMSSQTHDTFLYWVMALFVVQPISNELFTSSSPVTLY
jgi:hypothetical protein